MGNQRLRLPKPELHISQLVDQIETKFQKQISCFHGRAFHVVIRPDVKGSGDIRDVLQAEIKVPPV